MQIICSGAVCLFVFSYSLEEGCFSRLLNPQKPRNAAGSSAYNLSEKCKDILGGTDSRHNGLDWARNHDDLDMLQAGGGQLGTCVFATRVFGHYMSDPVFAKEAQFFLNMKRRSRQ